MVMAANMACGQQALAVVDQRGLNRFRSRLLLRRTAIHHASAVRLAWANRIGPLFHKLFLKQHVIDLLQSGWCIASKTA